MNSDDKFAIAGMIVICATILGMIGMLVSCGNELNTATEADEKTVQDVSLAIEHANGCPLDAVEYDAPAFASGGKALKVTDRFSKSEWWLVKMGGKWVTLPIESEEAGK
jgi:hypothetical protein